MSDSKVARWTTADIQPAEHGDFVAYGDYLTLERENQVLKDALIVMTDKGIACRTLERENAALQAEVSRLTENARLQDSATAAVMERAEKAEAEVKEQCRLLAMGSEREASLMARVQELERDVQRYRWLRDGEATCDAEDYPVAHDQAGNALWDRFLDAAIDAAMRGTE